MSQKVVINKSLKVCISFHFLAALLLFISNHSTKSSSKQKEKSFTTESNINDEGKPGVFFFTWNTLCYSSYLLR